MSSTGETVRRGKSLDFSACKLRPGNWFAPPDGYRTWLLLGNEKHSFLVSSIRSHEVARSQPSSVRHCEAALKALDFGNRLLGVHSVPISNMGVAIVKRSGICAFPQ